MEKPSFTIPRDQISILAGASGAGKTTLLFQALSRWARGEIFLPELTWDATKILYVAADRTVNEAKFIAEKMGLPGIGSDDCKVTFYGLVDDLSINKALLSSPLALLNYIISGKTFDLLILDPIGIFIDGSMNNYHHVARSLIPLNQLALKRHITILATHHTSKARTDFTYERPQDRINGSKAFLGYSGTQMVLISPEELKKDWYELHVISHVMASMEVLLERGQIGDFHVAYAGVPKSINETQFRRGRFQRT